ncbi:hypothetical protein ACWGII_29705 [Streptomyces sp. NPDC054855]
MTHSPAASSRGIAVAAAFDSAAVAGRLAEEFAAALHLPPDAVVVQHTVAETATAPGAVAVVRGRPRDIPMMHRAVERAGALLSAELGIHPDLIFVSWPHPGTASTGAHLLP